MKNLNSGGNKSGKNKGLSLQDMAKLYHGVGGDPDNKIVGYIGGVPVISNPKVPEGEMWILDEKQFKLIK